MATFKFLNEQGQWEAIESPGAVKYTEQKLSEEQQFQARENIGVNRLLDAFSAIKVVEPENPDAVVGEIVAEDPTDALILAAGKNVILQPVAEKKEIIIEAVNTIEGIIFNGTKVTVNEDGVAEIVYELPLANTSKIGGVKSIEAILDEDGKVTNASAIENKIAVLADGTMEVNTLNVNKLVQSEGSSLFLNCGNASPIN